MLYAYIAQNLDKTCHQYRRTISICGLSAFALSRIRIDIRILSRQIAIECDRDRPLD